MTILELLQINPEKAKDIICQNRTGKDYTFETWENEYAGKHKILSDINRQAKSVGSGQNQRYVYPATLTMTFQKKIVREAVNFLFGSPVELVLNNEEAEYQEPFQKLLDAWKDNRVDAFNKELMTDVCIYTQAAELWYTTGNVEDKTAPPQIGVNLLSYDTSEELYPYFNEFGQMIAMARKFIANEIDDQGTVQKIKTTVIYTSDTIYTFRDTTGDGAFKQEVNPFGKIPVIYYEQETTEWNDVQRLIDRLEMLISRHADTNDYFGSPILEVWGEFVKMPEKEDDGKSIQIAADVNKKTGEVVKKGGFDFKTWDFAPQSIDLEMKNLKEFIYSLTSTPDLSFNNVKGLSNLSGIAIKLMFMDAVLKAYDHQILYGEMLDRRLKVMQAILGKMNLAQEKLFKDMSISVKFTSVLPDNIQETITNLITAAGGDAIMSQETAVKRNPYVDSPETEIELLDAQREASNNMGGTFNV